ncbi:hypothetical protein [Micromonospora aurantiaca (nom. illeg.)]|uniref:hypothetical protein n=1 Tax=Micromonospora aurantiaca (nom. illeg.) TaxID=47850 RepID=UPI00210A6CA8|nr:hypothetical protein [Micromonospora aurantiaca]
MAGRDGGGQPGLAGAARAVQGDQPRRAQQLVDPPQFRFPADETGERAGEPGGRCGVVAQQRRVQCDQLRRRVGAQFLGEHPAGVGVRG